MLHELLQELGSYAQVAEEDAALGMFRVLYAGVAVAYVCTVDWLCVEVAGRAVPGESADQVSLAISSYAGVLRAATTSC